MGMMDGLCTASLWVWAIRFPFRWHLFQSYFLLVCFCFSSPFSLLFVFFSSLHFDFLATLHVLDFFFFGFALFLSWWSGGGTSVWDLM